MPIIRIAVQIENCDAIGFNTPSRVLTLAHASAQKTNQIILLKLLMGFLHSEEF